MSTTQEAPRRDGVTAFIEHLRRLGAREDRGALAALRRSLQDDSGMAAAACTYVVPFLPAAADAYRDRAYFLVGALFALDPRHAPGVSLGGAFRRMQSAGDDNPSLRARFAALLDAHPDDVADHVRHAASLARAKDIALDWEKVLRDLLAWRSADRYVQRRLAREFWGAAAPTTENEAPR